MTRATRRYVLLALVGAAFPTLRAQEAGALRVAASPRAARDIEAKAAFVAADTTSPIRAAIDRIPFWSAPLASAIIPGLGQARLRKDRFVAYMAAEAFLWLQYAKSTSDARDNASNFRAIARDIARRTFPGTHPDTSAWKYYESMEKYLESGNFTDAPSGPTVPETDIATFNGAQWVEARALFGIPLDDPDPVHHERYAQALALYERTAVQQAYGWSWRGAQLEQDLYRRSIARSNNAYRRATGDLLAIIANHAFSAVDAFASVRLIQAAGGEMRMSASIPLR
ncbi:MAG: hypothetical protein ABI625_24300 [bacterium]